MLAGKDPKHNLKNILIDFLKHPDYNKLNDDYLDFHGIDKSLIYFEPTINLYGEDFEKAIKLKYFEKLIIPPIQIVGLSFKGRLVFQNCRFLSNGVEDSYDFLIHRCEVESIMILGGTVDARIIFQDLNSDQILINNIKGKGRFLFSSVSANSFRISSLKGNFEESIFIDSNKINQLMIRDSKLENIGFQENISPSVFIGDGEYGKIDFNGSGPINDFRIESHGKKPDDLLIDEILLHRKQIDGKLDINGCSIKDFRIEYLHSIKDSFTLKDVRIIENFEISSSNIYNSFWNNLDLSTAEVVFDFTFFKDLRYAYVKWPELMKLSSKVDQNKHNIVLTEVYRQLKITAQLNQNIFEKLQFQGLEYHNYWNRVKTDKSLNSLDRFLLRVDKCFSNFGQAYFRPLVWLVSVQLVLLILIWWREDIINNYNAPNYSEAFENGFAQYVTMLIPVFKTPENWSGWSIVISVVIRLFNALQIYYFIRGVHKFGKNN